MADSDEILSVQSALNLGEERLRRFECQNCSNREKNGKEVFQKPWTILYNKCTHPEQLIVNPCPQCGVVPYMEPYKGDKDMRVPKLQTVPVVKQFKTAKFHNVSL
jgi:uncharacterized Zn finger protein